MEANTLQSVLRCKYNIHETLQAEGIFVALLSGTMDAVGLFSIGIGERCVVVAGINLCGPHIDYDLKSLTPAGLLGVTYKNCSKIITFSSQFKSKQSFQICSSAKAAAIWDEITTAIDCLRSKPSGEIWSSASLTTSSSSGASISGNHLNYRCLPRKMFHAADVSYSLTSLSDSESGPRDAKHAVWRQHVKKGHSLDCANLSFDNFVNYNDSNLNAIAQQVVWTAHVTVFGELGGKSTDDRKTDVSSKPSSLAERFRRFFSCCRNKR